MHKVYILRRPIEKVLDSLFLVMSYVLCCISSNVSFDSSAVKEINLNIVASSMCYTYDVDKTYDSILKIP